MAERHPNGADPAESFPGRTITLELSAAHVAYLRQLLFEDLQEWAEAVGEKAHGAAECGGIAGEETRDTYRRLVSGEILDVIGWSTRGDLGAMRWLEAEARQRMTVLSAVEDES